MTQTPARRRRRWPWILLALLIGLPLLAIGAAFVLLDAESLRPRLVAAVERATGRTFTVGEMRLALSLVPTLELRDVALANPPGASRPNMLTAQRVEVQAALLPLLSREIRITGIELEQPDLLLEVDAQGQPNWQFNRAPAATPGGPAQEASGQPLAIGVDSLRLQDGRVTWHDARSNRTETVQVNSLRAAAPLGGTITAEGEVVARGQPVTIEAETGGLAALGGPQPWPLRATLASAGAEARVQGTLTGAAWTGEASAQVPDLSALSPLVPGAALPPLKQVVASAAASGQGGTVEAVRTLRLAVGASDLGTLRPGLALRSAELTAESMTAPITIAAEIQAEGQALRIAGQAGTPALALQGGHAPLPVDLRLEGQGVSGTAKGRIAQPLTLSGIDLAVTAEAGDLARFGLAGPGSLSGQLLVPGPGLQGGVRLNDLHASIAPAEASGDLALALGARPKLAGALTFSRLDLDALGAARPAAPGAAAPAPPAAPAAAPAGDGRVIPDIALPFAALRQADADLRLAAPAVTAAGQAWRSVSAHLVLQDGKLRLNPLSAVTPAGPLAADLTADATQDPGRVRLVLNSPGLDLAKLAQALGRQPYLLGALQLGVDLAGQGGDLRGVLDSAAGSVGASLVDGAVPRSALRALPQEVVGIVAGGSGDIPLRCFALRAPAEAGVLRIQTLFAEGALGKIAGTGTVDLGEETLALRLQTDLRGAGVSLRAPATIAGPWTAPRIAIDPASAAAAGIGAFLSQQQTPDRSLQALADVLRGAQGGGAAAPLGECGPALAAARGGAAGPAPTVAGAPAAPAAAGPAPGQNPAVTPESLLRGLFGR